jgi:hypothetical protein
LAVTRLHEVGIPSNRVSLRRGEYYLLGKESTPK